MQVNPDTESKMQHWQAIHLLMLAIFDTVNRNSYSKLDHIKFLFVSFTRDANLLSHIPQPIYASQF